MRERGGNMRAWGGDCVLVLDLSDTKEKEIDEKEVKRKEFFSLLVP